MNTHEPEVELSVCLCSCVCVREREREAYASLALSDSAYSAMRTQNVVWIGVATRYLLRARCMLADVCLMSTCIRMLVRRGHRVLHNLGHHVQCLEQ